MIGAVVLAAGEAKRMGTAKQLLEWEGQPLIRYVVTEVLASGFDLVRVVTGAYSTEVERALENLPIEIMHNPNYAEGQSTSMKLGLSKLPEAVRGVAFILGDQPIIQRKTYKRLVEIFRETEPGILLPMYQGERGNPVFFNQLFFPDLLQVEGDRGGREIMRQNPEAIMKVEVDDEGIVIDLDVKADYEHYLQQKWRKKVVSNETWRD